MVESPIYGMVEVNGKLAFKEDEPQLNLRVSNMVVRTGQVIIGTPN